MYWLCCIYGVTFGGFVGLCSVLPLFFHDYYGMNLLSAGTMTALCGLAGSVIRPLGGYVADRIGGLASLRVVLPLIVLTVASIGYLPPLEWCVPFMIVAVGMMGFGNGVVFQIVFTGFTHRSDGVRLGGGGGRPRRVFRADCVGHLERHDGNVSHRILAVWRCRRDPHGSARCCCAALLPNVRKRMGRD